MKTRKPKILKVWIEHRPDSYPDTSHLGEYSSKQANEFAIDRVANGDAGRNEYRWFNPSFNYVKDNGELCDGLTPADVRNYTQQDYQRMEQFNRGILCYLGIIAKAEVQLTTYAVQVLHSVGLWGVESDSGDNYLGEVATEELSSLRTELEAIGFGKRAIDRAFATVETINK